jgi:hypothetical protein
MRAIKTKLLLVVAALAITAVAAPAGAAAEVHWTKEGAPLKTSENFFSQGNSLNLNTDKGGLSCSGFETWTYLSGNSNTGLLWVAIAPSDCKTSGGKAFCQIESLSLLNNGAWSIAGSLGGIGSGLGITVKYKAGGFCGSKEDAYSGGYWLNVDNINEMSYWTPTYGVEVLEDGATKNTASVGGKFNLGQPKIYGIAN